MGMTVLGLLPSHLAKPGRVAASQAQWLRALENRQCPWRRPPVWQIGCSWWWIRMRWPCVFFFVASKSDSWRGSIINCKCQWKWLGKCHAWILDDPAVMIPTSHGSWGLDLEPWLVVLTRLRWKSLLQSNQVHASWFALLSSWLVCQLTL